jgi:hypothetical protein
MHAGSATVNCVNGAITASFTAVKGVSLTGQKNVVASCENSAFSSPSSCGTTNKVFIARTATATGVALQSSDWDNACTCRSTGRRPVFTLTVPEVVMGSLCTKP